MKTHNTPDLSGVIYNYILDQLLDHTLYSGSRINEVEIAEKLGVSRTPVRTALRKLENDGVVNIYPNRFVEVAPFEKVPLRDLGVTRIALECAAVKLAIYNGSDAEFYDLAELADQTFCREEKWRDNILLDTSFHFKIFEISKSELLKKYYKQTDTLVKYILSYMPNLTMPNVTHNMIVDAMLRRDVAETEKMVTRHLYEFYKIPDLYE